MQAYLIDFVNLLLRWLHVIAAIAWIGESIYFVMLDNSLRTPKAEEDREKGVFGEMWSVHGGGFYHNQKYATAPSKLPNDLHWSFWKAYTTWLSGFALFVILYMVNPGFYLVNPNSPWEWAANMTGWQANILALAFLLGGWVVYNELCKRISPNMDRDGLLSIAVAVMMVIVAYLSTQMFTGRAAFLLTGAVMATAMSANDAPNPLDGKRGKQRSVHNTYFTLPVVLLMVSNHYSFIYSHELAWVVMVLFIFAGALIRQFFVLMHAGKTQPAYPAFGVGLILLAFWVAAPSASSTSGDAGAQGPDQAQITGLIEQHCVQCHARNPEHAGFSAPPAGFAFDSWDEILSQKAQIQQVVASQYMPLGNMTNMSDEERDIIAAWEE